MAPPLTSGWVILLNKSPRGPFSEEEVVSLIQQKLVRPNDMALRVSGETKSNWRLIKTYPEFQSAFSGTISDAVVTDPQPIITPVNFEDLPELKAEDLVPRTVKNVFENRLEETAVEAMPLPALKRDSPFGLLKRLSPLMGLFLLFFVGFEIFRSNSQLPNAVAEKEGSNPIQANIAAPKPKTRFPTALAKEIPAKKVVEEVAPPPPPPAPAQVEKSDDRSNEEKASELADRGSRTDDDRSNDDDEEVKPKRKKKAKKVIEDEESESSDDHPDSAS